MNHISVLEIYLDKLVYRKLLCIELSDVIYSTPILYSKSARIVTGRFDIHFQKKILLTDEACFTRRCITNLHNYHGYSDVSPHSVTPRHFQREFKIHVWIEFLQNTLPDLLDEVPLHLRLEHWFMHDGAPPQFSIMVRDFLNHQYPNKWIERGNNCPQVWPPRSPDFNKCDFFLWGTLKEFVYSSPVASRAEL
ncbi:hypothetical protein NQ318_010806 [Aromia moschata]|uniref:Uncharacterized protein n=1 Tax=Aromia moschata TaxID=1265417 RepID=A0AAV8XEU3_9CUCU|nr:hypothetical protein NQ318_010806 [Aromia moschata]